MFTELTTVEVLHCVTFITKAAPQAWKALFSFREHNGSSIHTLKLVRKGLKLFLVNVDFKIKVRKLASKLSPIYTLHLWDSTAYQTSITKKGNNQLCLDKPTTIPMYLQGKKSSKLPPQKLFLIFHRFISNRIKGCCLTYFINTYLNTVHFNHIFIFYRYMV